MKQIILILLLLAGCWACNDEPQFPDPGLDMVRNVKDTVRRDTIDTYYLEMNVKALNGVKTVQILNGRNYDVLEDLTAAYGGKTEFLLRYPIDLTDIDQDSVMHFVVKVIDNNLRAYNKGFSLVVKKHSAPEIRMNIGKVLGVVSPVFELKARFETGLNTIKSYKLSFDGVVLDEQAITDTLIYELRYVHLCQVNMEKGQEYTLKIELTDNKDQTATETVTVSLLDGRHAYQVYVFNQKSGQDQLYRILEFHYNPANENLLDSISGIQYVYTLTADRRDTVLQKPIGCYFGYNAQQQVDSFTFVDRFGEVSGWSFKFDGQGRVTDVNGFGKDDNDYDIVVEDWLEDGQISAFYRWGESTVTSEINYEEMGGKQYPAEYWVSNAIGKKRQICTDMNQVSIPTWLPALSPVMPIVVVDEMFPDLLMYQYGFEKVQEISEGDPKEIYTMIYTTNQRGELERITKKKGAAVSRKYIFNYDK